MNVSTSAARILLIVLLVLAAALFAAGCGDGGGSDDGGSDERSEASGGGTDEDDVAARDGMYDEAPTERLDPSKEYVVEVETTEGTFDIEVDPEAAPIAAANFVHLVEEGFYDGTTFHRIMRGFMIQGGDPLGTGAGGPGYTIEDEPVKGTYVEGAVAMARTPEPDSAGSQFFIVHGPNGDRNLTRDYVIFGHVSKDGLEVVDRIANVEVQMSDTGESSDPVEDVRIVSATLTDS